jgi:hypothetical protein
MEEPVVIFLSDQAFPRILQASDGSCSCAVVVRVEDRRLFETKGAFMDIYSVVLSPHGKLPMCSVVL